MNSYRTRYWPQSDPYLVHFRKSVKQPGNLTGSEAPTQALDHSPRTDMQISDDCERVLAALTPASDYAILVMVSNGWVTLSGYVAEGYERAIAETEISSLPGVHGVSTQVRVRPLHARNGSGAGGDASVHHQDELKSGSYEFVRSYDGITWSEMRDSWAARRALLHAAWSASGTKRVADRMRAS